MPIYDLGKVVGPKGDTGDPHTCTVITDWNDAVTPGFYYSADDAAHAPTFTSNGGGIYGIVFRYGNQVKQVVTQQFGNDCKVRFCNAYNNDTWYSWMQFISNATTSYSGLMSASDKKKLDQIVPMTESEYQTAVKDPNTYYLVG